MNTNKILVFDEDVKISHSLGVILQSYGYHVDTVVGGFEAIGMMAYENYKVVVSDFDLTREGGGIIYDFLEATKETHKLIFYTYEKSLTSPSSRYRRTIVVNKSEIQQLIEQIHVMMKK